MKPTNHRCMRLGTECAWSISSASSWAQLPESQQTVRIHRSLITQQRSAVGTPSREHYQAWWRYSADVHYVRFCISCRVGWIAMGSYHASPPNPPPCPNFPPKSRKLPRLWSASIHVPCRSISVGNTNAQQHIKRLPVYPSLQLH